MMLRRIGWIVLLIPMTVIAAPTTQPTAAPKARPAGDRVERLGSREAREADWDEALKFFQKHSPHRAAAWESMKEPRKTRYKALFIMRYRSMLGLTRDDAQLRRIKISQIEIEDRIFAIKSRLSESNLASADADQLKRELHGKVKELVASRMDERKERITRLESLLKLEKDRLQKDLANKDQLIESQYKDVLSANKPGMADDRLWRQGTGPRESAKGPAPKGR
ncbi:MAG: hypothetical protein ACM359_01390 [Bacillota bacterium]